MEITLFYLYKAAAQLLPVYPVYLLIFQRNGMAIPEISTLLIIWSIPGFLLEVPSSVLADRWNRRNLMVLGRLLKGACFAVWAFSNTFGGYALGFVLWGTGGALTSGTEEAWLYDHLKGLGREDEFDRIWGKGHFYYRICVALACITGSVIANFSIPFTLWFSVGMSVCSAIFGAMLPECNLYRGDTDQEVGMGLKDCLSTLMEGAGFCLSDRLVAVMVGFVTLVLVSAGVMDEYDQVIVRAMGVPLALVGTWGFLRYSVEALGGRFAWRIKPLFTWYGSPVIAPAIRMAAASGVLLAASALCMKAFILPAYALYYLLQSAARIVITDSLQKKIKDQGRATVQSLVNMLEAPSGIALYGFFGFSSRYIPFNMSIILSAGLILGFCLLFGALARVPKSPPRDIATESPAPLAETH